MSDNIKSSGEDYLEAIYNLAEQTGRVRSVDVAGLLDVTRPSVNKAMGQLLKAGMIEKLPYGDISLTQKGLERAKLIANRHKMLKLFLSDILKVDDDIAEEDACRMEHGVSDQTMQKLIDYLEKHVLT